jgi:hypothetical protein
MGNTIAFLFAMGIAVPVFSQSERGISWKINHAADILYTLFDINTSNLFMNYRARPDTDTTGRLYFFTCSFTLTKNIYPIRINHAL